MSNKKVLYGQNTHVSFDNDQYDITARRSGSASEGRQVESDIQNAESSFGKTGDISHLEKSGPPPSGPEVTNTLFNSGRWGGRRKTKRNQKKKKKTRRVNTKRSRLKKRKSK
jgi:hypothetical protein